MNASISCSCGCSPCVCGSASAGCVADFCAPRPSFFQGQLVTADDLNSVVTYFGTQETILTKLVAGWGVMGGMRLLQAGAQSFHLFEQMNGSSPNSDYPPEVFPNPQIVPGTRIQVSAGAAADNAGRVLPLCAPQTIDILALSKGLGVPFQTEEATYWLGDLVDHSPVPVLTAAQYWVIAEYTETPVRPMPRLAGGACCDTVPACDFSRQLPGVRIRLVPDLPFLYFLHGCLDAITIPGLEQLLSLLFDSGSLSSVLDIVGGSATPGLVSAMSSPPNIFGPSGASEAAATLFSCSGFKLVPQLLEFLNQITLNVCCSAPAVALGRVLLATDVPTEIVDYFDKSYPYYVLIDDAFPYRRSAMNGANIQTLLAILLSVLVCNSSSPPGG